MEMSDIFDSQELDPYDREERCRKTIRAVARAMTARIAAGVLLLVALVRSGASPAVLCLMIFVLLIVAAGTLPLVRELGKQRRLLKESLAQQEQLEKKEK